MPNEPLHDIGRLLVFAGIGLAVLGGVLLLVGRVPGLGHLPGDMSWERGNTRIYFPLGTMIVISVVLTLLVNVVIRLFKG